ncbi:unnamed protein product [Gulo gulo]|uniref:Uncharacterized protein n=1 Tax=Gulo gulo TaxID=48420 RepID=A0A9X9LP06_GULGU|nr:unnamed protein product [Gulo gulo]
MADKTCTPEERSISMEQPNPSTEKAAPRPKRKKEKKGPCQPKPRSSGKVQKKTTKAKRPLQRNLRKETSPSSPSCSRIRKAAIRPMIFICYHKGTKAHSEHGENGMQGHWKMQPSQVTFCAASKCRAWARKLELATASYEAAVENC